jgi:hypothetical protein
MWGWGSVVCPLNSLHNASGMMIRRNGYIGATLTAFSVVRRSRGIVGSIINEV